MLYPKIETYFNRFPESHEQKFKVNEEDVRRAEFKLIDRWLMTEKVDGMNIGVDFINGTHRKDVMIHGRTYRAQLPKQLEETLKKLFTFDKLSAALEYRGGLPEQVTLFMEGYGPGIQKGGKYRPDQHVKLFDVNVDGMWLNWDSVTDIANKLFIQTVPIYAIKTVEDVIADLKEGLMSTVARVEGGEELIAEGVVARTDPILLDRFGKRIVWKLKTRDFSVQEKL